MTGKMRRWTLIYASAFFACAICSVHSVDAETNAKIMKRAVEEYRQGNFNDAAGDFYATLTSEFSNATVHYYMASCYAHLNDTESAAREFRIAYALAPNSDIGYYSNIALKYFHFNSDGSVVVPTGKTVTTGSSTTTAAFSKTNASVAGALTNTSSLPGIWKANDAIQSQAQKNTRLDPVQKTAAASGRHVSTDVKGEKQTLNLPDDIKSVLSNLKNDYEHKREKQVSVGRAPVTPPAPTTPPAAPSSATAQSSPSTPSTPSMPSTPLSPGIPTTPLTSTAPTPATTTSPIPSAVSTPTAPETASDSTHVKPSPPPTKFYPPFQP